MNELQSYEAIVPKKGKDALLRKGAWILGYIFWFSLFFVWSTLRDLDLPILILGILSTVAVILLTWKYAQIEYEYTLAGGSFFLAKIYGKRKRKTVLEANIKHARLIAPYTQDYVNQAESLSPKEILWAVSSPSAKNIWMLLWDDEEQDKRILLMFEAEERSLRILRQENPRAVAREALTFFKKTAT
ncbi:MAG: hypothetical protein IJY47_00970 [Clostridia bacterium]|nr:hypothetical protein [Clostridia bacterium]